MKKKGFPGSFSPLPPTITYVSTQGTQKMVPILSTLSEPSMDDKMLRSF